MDAAVESSLFEDAYDTEDHACAEHSGIDEPVHYVFERHNNAGLCVFLLKPGDKSQHDCEGSIGPRRQRPGTASQAAAGELLGLD